MNDSRGEYPPEQLYRDPERGAILGVCAGLAEFLAWPTWLIRSGVLVLTWIFMLPVIVAYFVTAMILPQRPLRYYGDGDERAFWQSRRRRS